MVARLREVRRDGFLAADAVLGLLGIDDPSEQARVGAALVGEFLVKGIASFDSFLGIKRG